MDTDYVISGDRLYVVSGYRLRHIWIQTIPHLDTDYNIRPSYRIYHIHMLIKTGYRLYHTWIQTISHLDTDYITPGYRLFHTYSIHQIN